MAHPASLPPKTGSSSPHRPRVRWEKRGRGGLARRVRIALQKKPRASPALFPTVPGSVPFHPPGMGGDRKNPASHPGTQLGTSCLHRTKKNPDGWRSCICRRGIDMPTETVPCSGGGLGGPHHSHPGISAGSINHARVS